jgi:hypothetical protein
VVDQTFGSRPRPERLLQRIQHQIRTHRAGNPPADNTPGKNINDEGHIRTANLARNRI